MLPRLDGVGDPIAEFVHSGHQGSPGGGAGCTYIEIIETDALIVQLIHIGRLQQGVTVPSDVPVTLVVGKYEDDIWLYRFCFS